MTEVQEVLFATWIGVVLIVWTLTSMARTDMHPMSRQERRDTALTILLAPIWPLVVVYLLLRYVPQQIGRLFYDATRRVE